MGDEEEFVPQLSREINRKYSSNKQGERSKKKSLILVYLRCVKHRYRLYDYNHSSSWFKISFCFLKIKWLWSFMSFIAEKEYSNPEVWHKITSMCLSQKPRTATKRWLSPKSLSPVLIDRLICLGSCVWFSIWETLGIIICLEKSGFLLEKSP